MKTLDKIPTGKIERAGQLVKTGIKVGGNYVAYYGEKIINPSLNRDKLNESNAEDIYDGLKNLKGSALKVAQMLSMDKNIMPRAYVEKFSLAQFKDFIINSIQPNPSETNKKIAKITNPVFSEGAWIQFLFLLKFWLDDTSKGFEKTDIAIEKSVTAAVDLLNTKPLENLLDLGKFLWKEGKMR